MSDLKDKDKLSIAADPKPANGAVSTHTLMKRLWILLFALIGVGVSLWLASSQQPERPAQSQTTSQQEDLYPSAKVYRKGNLNGTPIAIRADYLGSPITYADKSDWEPASEPDYYEKKNFADAVVGFDVVVHWPTMESHRPSNHPSWLTYRSSKPTEWISVSVVGDLKPEARPPYKADNGLARAIKGHMDDVARSPQKRIGADGQLTQVELHYELFGLDPITGLRVAKAAGRDADRPGGGNYTFYWEGDLANIVRTSIRCPAGVLPNPGSVHTCEHKFELVERGAYVSVRYTENMLPQWREIEARTRELILSLRVDPKNSSIR